MERIRDSALDVPHSTFRCGCDLTAECLLAREIVRVQLPAAAPNSKPETRDLLGRAPAVRQGLQNSACLGRHQGDLPFRGLGQADTRAMPITLKSRFLSVGCRRRNRNTNLDPYIRDKYPSGGVALLLLPEFPCRDGQAGKHKQRHLFGEDTSSSILPCAIIVSGSDQTETVFSRMSSIES